MSHSPNETAYMKRCISIVAKVTLLCTALGPAASQAWELQLKDQVALARAVVRLGDIAGISGLPAEDVQRLEQIIVAPGPTHAYSRTMSTSQLHKVLSQRGVDMAQCRLSGSPRVVVTFDGRAPSAPSQRAVVSSAPGTASSYDEILPPETRAVHYRAHNGMAMVQNIEEALAEQVSTHLMRLANDQTPWEVQVKILPRSLQDMPSDWSTVAIEGVENAIEGQHQLVALFRSAQGDVRLPVEASASRKVQLVVATKALRRGDVIGAGDVELRFVGGQQDPLQVVTRLEDVVGRLVQYPVREHEPLRASALKKPVLVKRRDEITVVARRAGIQITTTGLALDEGTMGDVISVQRLDESKERFVARVIGVQQAEVFVSNSAVTAWGKH